MRSSQSTFYPLIQLQQGTTTTTTQTTTTTCRKIYMSLLYVVNAFVILQSAGEH